MEDISTAATFQNAPRERSVISQASLDRVAFAHATNGARKACKSGLALLSRSLHYVRYDAISMYAHRCSVVIKQYILTCKEFSGI